MTYQGGEFSVARLYEELKDSVREEKIQTQGEYNSLVDAIVDEKLSYGFFSEEEDIEQIKKNLRARWHEVEGEVVERVVKYLG